MPEARSDSRKAATLPTSSIVTARRIGAAPRVKAGGDGVGRRRRILDITSRISIPQEALERYRLTDEELCAWEAAMTRHGAAALRAAPVAHGAACRRALTAVRFDAQGVALARDLEAALVGVRQIDDELDAAFALDDVGRGQPGGALAADSAVQAALHIFEFGPRVPSSDHALLLFPETNIKP